MLALHSSINSNVINNAYSNFSSAPQISTANILYSIIGGVLKLPIAKTINIWGRAEGYVFFIGVYTVGLIIVAACNNRLLCRWLRALLDWIRRHLSYSADLRG